MTEQKERAPGIPDDLSGWDENNFDFGQPSGLSLGVSMPELWNISREDNQPRSSFSYKEHLSSVSGVPTKTPNLADPDRFYVKNRDGYYEEYNPEQIRQLGIKLIKGSDRLRFRGGFRHHHRNLATSNKDSTDSGTETSERSPLGTSQVTTPLHESPSTFTEQFTKSSVLISSDKSDLLIYGPDLGLPISGLFRNVEKKMYNGMSTEHVVNLTMTTAAASVQNEPLWDIFVGRCFMNNESKKLRNFSTTERWKMCYHGTWPYIYSDFSVRAEMEKDIGGLEKFNDPKLTVTLTKDSVICKKMFDLIVAYQLKPEKRINSDFIPVHRGLSSTHEKRNESNKTHGNKSSLSNTKKLLNFLEVSLDQNTDNLREITQEPTRITSENNSTSDDDSMDSKDTTDDEHIGSNTTDPTTHISVLMPNRMVNFKTIISEICENAKKMSENINNRSVHYSILQEQTRKVEKLFSSSDIRKKRYDPAKDGPYFKEDNLHFDKCFSEYLNWQWIPSTSHSHYEDAILTSLFLQQSNAKQTSSDILENLISYFREISVLHDNRSVDLEDFLCEYFDWNPSSAKMRKSVSQMLLVSQNTRPQNVNDLLFDRSEFIRTHFPGENGSLHYDKIIKRHDHFKDETGRVVALHSIMDYDFHMVVDLQTEKVEKILLEVIETLHKNWTNSNSSYKSVLGRFSYCLKTAVTERYLELPHESLIRCAISAVIGRMYDEWPNLVCYHDQQVYASSQQTHKHNNPSNVIIMRSKEEREKDRDFGRKCFIHWNNLTEDMWNYFFSKVSEVAYALATEAVTLPTPTQKNSGTRNNQGTSCFLFHNISDSTTGIYGTLEAKEAGSRLGGGTAIFQDIRCQGSLIKGINGISAGVGPFNVLTASSTEAISQAANRRGAHSTQTSIMNADINWYISHKNTKQELSSKSDSKQIFFGVIVNDFFMKKVQNDQDIALFCMSDCEKLFHIVDLGEYEATYNAYLILGYAKRIVKAKELLKRIAERSLQSGDPYCISMDNANKLSMQVQRNEHGDLLSVADVDKMEYQNYEGFSILRQTNLCVEVFQPTESEKASGKIPAKHSACNLSSVNVPIALISNRDENTKLNGFVLVTRFIMTELNGFFLREVENYKLDIYKDMDSLFKLPTKANAATDTYFLYGSSENTFYSWWISSIYKLLSSVHGTKNTDLKFRDDYNFNVIRRKMFSYILCIPLASPHLEKRIEELNLRNDNMWSKSLDVKNPGHLRLIALTDFVGNYLATVRDYIHTVVLKTRASKNPFLSNKLESIDYSMLFYSGWMAACCADSFIGYSHNVTATMHRYQQDYRSVIVGICGMADLRICSEISYYDMGDSLAMETSVQESVDFGGLMFSLFSRICNSKNSAYPRFNEGALSKGIFHHELYGKHFGHDDRRAGSEKYVCASPREGSLIVQTPTKLDDLGGVAQKNESHFHFPSIVFVKEKWPLCAKLDFSCPESYLLPLPSAEENTLLFPSRLIVSGIWNWNTWRKILVKYGTKNSTITGNMPTSNASNVSGYTPSIQPIQGIYAIKSGLLGETVEICWSGVTLLHKYGFWNKDVKTFIAKNNGSIKGCPGIPARLQSILSTAYEIQPEILVIHDAFRGAFTTQSSSNNRYLSPEFSNPEFVVHLWMLGHVLGLLSLSYYIHVQEVISATNFSSIAGGLTNAKRQFQSSTISEQPPPVVQITKKQEIVTGNAPVPLVTGVSKGVGWNTYSDQISGLFNNKVTSLLLRQESPPQKTGTEKDLKPSFLEETNVTFLKTQKNNVICTDGSCCST